MPSPLARQRVLGALTARRRWIAAVLVGLAVASVVQAVTPSHPRTALVWVAATDLPGGTPLGATDLRPQALPLSAVPAGAIPTSDSLVHRVLGAPLRAGEPVTDIRLLGPDLLAAAAPGDVAAPVHLTDATAMAGVVHAGDTVDVLASDPAGSLTNARASPPVTAEVLARDLTVLAPPVPDAEGSGAMIVLAASAGQAARLSAGATTGALSVVLTDGAVVHANSDGSCPAGARCGGMPAG